MSEISTLEDDGLKVLEVGSWTEKKYRLVAIYCSLFSTSMKDKWENRVYIDLFAGPGRSRVRESNRITPGSPTIAMKVKHTFTRYIFCEEDGDSLRALQERHARDFSALDARFVLGNCNSKIDEIMSHIPRPTTHSKVLSFCFADPFGVSDLHFSTLERLSSVFIDFLILIPTQMDASRNWTRELKKENETPIDILAGSRAWREKWISRSSTKLTFDAFFAEFFSDRMRAIGYNYGGFDKTVLIRNPEKNQRLYRLGFYSKHQRGEYFWKQAMKYSSEQLKLGL
jgi:three-Cys-motif partner protein